MVYRGNWKYAWIQIDIDGRCSDVQMHGSDAARNVYMTIIHDIMPGLPVLPRNNKCSGLYSVMENK